MNKPHAPSWYAETADSTLAFPPLDGDTSADVVIVGGGYTGLSAALHLAEAGVDTILIEAEKVGWGGLRGAMAASCIPAQRRDQDFLEKRLGKGAAHELWDLAEEAKALVHHLIDKHKIDAEWRPGLIETVHKQRLVAEERHYVDKLNRDYGYAPAEWIDREQLAPMIGTDSYFGGRLDRTAGHLHPLKFAQGLARAAAKAGARIHEGTAATRLNDGATPVLETPRGRIRAETVILAGNGLLDGIDPGGRNPGDADQELHPHHRADRRRWRGRAHPPRRGCLGFTFRRLLLAPHAGRAHPVRGRRDLLADRSDRHLRLRAPASAEDLPAAGGGRGSTMPGVARSPSRSIVSPSCARCAAASMRRRAIPAREWRWRRSVARSSPRPFSAIPASSDAFAALPCPRFPGGKLLRWPALVAGMSWYALRDRI